MCKIPSESLIRIQGVGTMACGTAPVVNSIVCALPPPGLRGATHWGRFQRMWPARACNTLERTLHISVITLINKVVAPRVGAWPLTQVPEQRGIRAKVLARLPLQ